MRFETYHVNIQLDIDDYCGEIMKVAIFSPAGIPDHVELEKILPALERNGLNTTLIATKPHHKDPLLSNTIQFRADQLNSLLFSSDFDVVWASRGGYGCQDLLPHIDWEKSCKSKILIGFSDITALQIALFQKKNLVSIHGPMPATSYWSESASAVKDTIAVIHKHKAPPLQLEALSTKAHKSRLKATLSGGCFSVLTNLIGTPYFKPPEGILFLEDIGEHPGRILRSISQWQQTGYLEKVTAVIFGRFIECHDAARGITENDLIIEMALRLNIPTFKTLSIGHQIKNSPIGVGAIATIEECKLNWSL